MKPSECQRWQNARNLAEHLYESHDGHLTVAMPLGLGKANHLINALYGFAKDRPSYSLTILTALSLQTPQPAADLARRFFEPIAKRLYSEYEELQYARDLKASNLPINVRVSEFFLQAGVYLSNAHAQQNYISANYSDVSSYLLEQDIDVVLQMVAMHPRLQEQVSLSCNPDITLELLTARQAGEIDFLLVGEHNDELPYMPNDAQITEQEFAHILEGECAKSRLFNVPKPAIQLNEFAAGFHASSLVRDGGTLQIGIGSAGDAVAYALIMRQQDNANYRRIIKALNHGKDITHLHLAPFETGLYGVSEMFVDVFLDLIEAGVVKREVNGVLIHGGFFLGPRSMYRRLREMPATLLDKINMTAIGYINGAHVDFNKKQQNRQHARFINNAMKVTLLGAVVSDGLESGGVVSGVGGQYDFVRQSFALKGARSVIMMKAVRHSRGKQTSNIVWSYGHATIPRHLRDIVVNEYGIADCRGARDEDVVMQLLSITDAAFQAQLLEKAKTCKKVSRNSALDRTWQRNSQEYLAQILQPYIEENLLPTYPFGTDFTEEEQRLIPLLESLNSQSHSKIKIFKWVLKGLRSQVSEDSIALLKRLGLDAPSTVSQRLTRWCLLGLMQA